MHATGQSTATGYASCVGASYAVAAASPLATGTGLSQGSSYADAFGIATTYSGSVGSSSGLSTVFGRGSWKTTAYTSTPFAAFMSETGLFALLEESGLAEPILDDDIDIFVLDSTPVDYVLTVTTPVFAMVGTETECVLQSSKHTALLVVNQSNTICQTTARDLWLQSSKT